MAIMRYDPYRSMSDIPRRLNRLFDSFWPTRWDDEQLTATGWRPRVDVYDQDGTAVIQAELPGVKKEDVEIDLRGNVLILKGKRECESEVDENNYYCKERFYGSFQRAFTLPEAVDPGSVEANFHDGVLKVKIPKPEVSAGQKIQIR